MDCVYCLNSMWADVASVIYCVWNDPACLPFIQFPLCRDTRCVCLMCWCSTKSDAVQYRAAERLEIVKRIRPKEITINGFSYSVASKQWYILQPARCWLNEQTLQYCTLELMCYKGSECQDWGPSLERPRPFPGIPPPVHHSQFRALQ